MRLSFCRLGLSRDARQSTRLTWLVLSDRAIGTRYKFLRKLPSQGDTLCTGVQVHHSQVQRDRFRIRKYIQATIGVTPLWPAAKTSSVRLVTRCVRGGVDLLYLQRYVFAREILGSLA